MNLENLNLVELNAQEVKETEGGFQQATYVHATVLWEIYGGHVTAFLSGLTGIY
jgi:hypothetical protein